MNNEKVKVLGRKFRRRSDIAKAETISLSGEAELRVAIEAAGLGIFDYYPLTGDLHWTHKVKEHFGLSPDAHINYNVFLVGLHADDRARVDGLVRAALQRGSEGRFAAEYRTVGIEDRSERWIEAHGQAFFNDHAEAVRFIGTTLDVTARKQAEQASRESEERYRMLFDKSPFPKLLIDLETFRFLEVNEAATAYYGYSRDEFLHLTLADIRDGEELERRTAIEGRTRHRKKNNEIIDVVVQEAELICGGKKALLSVVVPV